MAHKIVLSNSQGPIATYLSSLEDIGNTVSKAIANEGDRLPIGYKITIEYDNVLFSHSAR